MAKERPGSTGLAQAPHPADSPTLPILMVVFVILGLAGLCTRGLVEGTEGLVLAALICGAFFACALIELDPVGRTPEVSWSMAARKDVIYACPTPC